MSYQVLHVIVQLDSHHRVDGGVPFVVVRLASEAVIRLHARNHTLCEVCSFDAQYYFAHAHVKISKSVHNSFSKNTHRCVDTDSH